MSNSLQPHGLYSPWNSPGQNTEVGSLSQPRVQTQVSHIAGGFFTAEPLGEPHLLSEVKAAQSCLTLCNPMD